MHICTFQTAHVNQMTSAVHVFRMYAAPAAKRSKLKMGACA
jgi:hypothetical protein